MNNFKSFLDYLKGKKSSINTSGKRTFPFKGNLGIYLTIAFTIVIYFTFLPPLNIHSRQTWVFLMAIQVFLLIFAGNKVPAIKWRFFFLVIMLTAYVLLSLTSLELFTAKSYANVIQIQDGNFSEDIKQPSLEKIPTLDRDSSERVGSRKMGELLDLASQFNLDNQYTQINYKNKPVRVTPLKYNGILKYLFNFKDGLPGYVEIDIVDGKARLVRLEEGIKYSQSDILFRNIDLYTRVKYPFEIFDYMEFEIDDEGRPQWVIPTYKNSVGWFGAMDVKNVITVDAISGESNIYSVEEAPKWIDRVYNSDRIIRQLDWAGKYKLGYLNSIFAQKQVLETTEGYNYVALNDDLYLYTGYTSVAGDESNVGFIMSNLRTKETKFYPVSSAKEISAMESAEGVVQDKKYQSTFPLLFNINNKPTYFLSLKDNAGLIKEYAFVDAQDYQRVSTGASVEEAYARHTGTVIEKNEFDENTQFKEIQARITDIYTVVIDGNTHYYFTLDDQDGIFVSSIKLSDKLPFLESGSEVKLKYADMDTKKVVSIEVIN
ncbi:MAG: hypothetical protein Q4E50_05435 [Tissierellia bacterium]|nr:hypothetical protein [Tissierellia bacterium]